MLKSKKKALIGKKLFPRVGKSFLHPCPCADMEDMMVRVYNNVTRIVNFSASISD